MRWVKRKGGKGIGEKKVREKNDEKVLVLMSINLSWETQDTIQLITICHRC